MNIVDQAIFYGAVYLRKGPYMIGVDSDFSKLIPTFRDKVQTLIFRMNQNGFDAFMYEGFRTPERAAQLAQQGVGIANSLHTIGAAADIISISHMWNAPASFWNTLGTEAKKLGLTWGGDFHKKDLDHVQAVSVAEEPNFRALASNFDRDNYLRSKVV